MHTQRLFVVLSNQAVCTSSDWDVVVGCPLSTAESFVTDYDIELPKGVCGNSKRSWVRVHGIQPIDKTLLLSKVGDLTGQFRHDLNVMISEHLELY
ncbi:type II toxin-antitoxin system PemK/MazF family toxin [Rhodococcus fascians]|nr:type II toxin-antitoxin system PemK/MazF family toxin [Rhodococcus fascians]MBY3999570.1 type II toxin-antitoxin system PemK/MazF family toxin [Rhodococcus fascians]MBY4001218.1 type II toxin-antitoxin system PemK/MazF family toxin [Rhodococcus fascians]MBY4009529.1 type II toxin-antitoxin system PemK/MazF family toxin [Rhodococcus fascians]MBY4015360.1 type II toxin-antitoxin system PemK/MazF family toxin [Rhodococcus fascians]